jgi:lysozyme
MNYVVQGIDVSHFQGKIDWQAVAIGGKAFTFIKATDGESGIDPLFRANWSQAHAAGLKRGAYHFLRPQQDPESQARNFLAALNDDPGELPPVLDFELLGGTQPPQALTSALRWMQIVEHACGRKPVLYTGPSFWRSALGSSSLLAEHPLWIAHYTTAPQPQIPQGWKDWTFWQYAEKGSVPGISGPVDLNRFHGTLMELEALCARIQNKDEVGAN